MLRSAALAAGLLVAVTGCGGGGQAAADESSAGLQALAATPGTLVTDPDASRSTVAISKVLSDSAATVLLASASDRQAQVLAASAAIRLRVPLLLTPAGTPAPGEDPWSALAGELSRLGAKDVLHVGPAPADVAKLGVEVKVVGADPASVGALVGDSSPTVEALPIDQVRERLAALPTDGDTVLVAIAPAPTPATGGLPGELKRAKAAEAPAGTFGLIDRDHPASIATTASMRAAGLTVVVAPHGDPRAVPGAKDVLAPVAPAHVLALGLASHVRSVDTALALSRTVATGTQLPGGGQLMFPGRRIVALYGDPGSKRLGVLGEQGPAESVQRAKALAAEFDGPSAEPVLPAFEIITTLADSDAGEDGDYSRESTIEELRPWVDAAAANGMYVVLDLQPGFTDFLTQAKRYEELLKLPHVGLALDPEWRLAPGQMHITHIGSVGADEVNATAAWLADIVRREALPQKLFLLHQFRLGMLKERERIDVPPELALLIQMDGNGTQPEKLDTWKQVLKDPPANAWFGWKNFYDEDKPTRSPADTVGLSPSPLFVSYQ